MEQLKNFADARLVNGCIYCGGLEETREHIPSKVLLQKPFPDNLPVMPACLNCNNGFSQDEEYVACLIECMMAGSTDPDKLNNSKIANILRRHPALLSRIEKAKIENNGSIFFTIEEERFINVIQKLAIGHAAFELSQVLRHKPTSIVCKYLHMMTQEEIDAYDAPQIVDIVGELGSRNMQRLEVMQVMLQSPTGELTMQSIVLNNWIEVQDGKYRYLAIDNGNSIIVKIIISEFLACEVIWEN